MITRLGIAMNMNSLPGQMWRWFDEMAKSALVTMPSGSSSGGDIWSIWNSHHRVSMYSCW